MGPERLSKIMTCGKYFENFRNTFTDENFARRTESINRDKTSEEKEFGKFFHHLIQNYVTNLETTELQEYLTELIRCQTNEKWTNRLIELLSPAYDSKTTESYLSSGDSENMERYLRRFSKIYHKYKLDQFTWCSELRISNFKFERFNLNGDIDLVGIDEETKKIFLIELKKAQNPYPQWEFQLYLYMLMLNEKYDNYQIFGAVWHPGAGLNVKRLKLAYSGINDALENTETNPVKYICADCRVWDCEDRK